MQLTPQEEYLYQMHLKNLMGPEGINRANFSRSTLRPPDAEVNRQRCQSADCRTMVRLLSPSDALAQSSGDGFPISHPYSDPMVARIAAFRYRQMLDDDVQRAQRLPIHHYDWRIVTARQYPPAARSRARRHGRPLPGRRSRHCNRRGPDAGLLDRQFVGKFSGS